jgi:hypothetical protein
MNDFPTAQEHRRFAEDAAKLRVQINAGLTADDPRFVKAIAALDQHRFGGESPEWGHQATRDSTRTLVCERRDCHALTLFVLTCWYDMQEDYPIVWTTRIRELATWINNQARSQDTLPNARMPRQKRLDAWQTWLNCEPNGFGYWFARTVNQIARENPNGAGNLDRWLKKLVVELMNPGRETREACIRRGPINRKCAQLKRATMLTMYLRRDQGIIRCLLERSVAKVERGPETLMHWYDGKTFPEIESELPVDTRWETLGRELFKNNRLRLHEIAEAAHQWGARHNLPPSTLDALFFSMDR